MNLDEMREQGIDCNDCYLSMQNCRDISICCEDETGLCDWFEEIGKEEGGQNERISNRDR